MPRDLSQRFVVQPNAPDHTEQKDFIRRTEPDFFHNRFWGDGMIRVTGREFNGVQASPCFRGGEFSCISCHEMHLDSPGQTDAKTWARTGQLKPKMDSDAACLQCHKDMSARLVAHTHHSRGVIRQPLLQLPHAAHNIRIAARDAQPSGLVAQRAGEHCLWSAKRLQSLPSRSNARMGCAASARMV